MCADSLPQTYSTRVTACRQEYLAEVQAILESSPEASAWSGAALTDTFEKCSSYFLLGWRSNEIAGFISGRRAADEGEILNLAVKPAQRRHGLGRSLVKALLELFTSHRVTQVFLEVRESNLGAITFYQNLGFHQVGRRESYYQNPEEAALVLAHK